MIKLPTEKELKENEKRWAKIHEILKADAKKQLKDNILLTAGERKLLTWMLEQKVFVGNIGTWMPSKEARYKLVETGLIEEDFGHGGFRDWLADEVKRLIQDGQVSEFIKLLSRFHPSIIESYDPSLKDKENVFYHKGGIWFVKFQNRWIFVEDKKRLYYLIPMLDKPHVKIPCSKLEDFVRSIKFKRTSLDRKFDDAVRADETRMSLENASYEELKDLQIMQIIGEETTQADPSILSFDDIKELNPHNADDHFDRLSSEDIERARSIRTNVHNNLKNIKKEIKETHLELYKHLEVCVSTGVTCIYEPDKDPSIKEEEWYLFL